MGKWDRRCTRRKKREDRKRGFQKEVGALEQRQNKLCSKILANLDILLLFCPSSASQHKDQSDAFFPFLKSSPILGQNQSGYPLTLLLRFGNTNLTCKTPSRTQDVVVMGKSSLYHVSFHLQWVFFVDQHCLGRDGMGWGVISGNAKTKLFYVSLVPGRPLRGIKCDVTRRVQQENSL